MDQSMLCTQVHSNCGIKIVTIRNNIKNNNKKIKIFIIKVIIPKLEIVTSAVVDVRIRRRQG